MAGDSVGLVGRAVEEQVIEEMLDRAECDAAQNLLVTGAPGVGKTALVRTVIDRRADALVLSGTCLPLASAAVPLLALRDLLRGVDDAVVSPGLRDAVHAAADGSDLLVQFDDWLAELTRVRPVILFIDDLQWADQGTLDLLTYLIAGPRSRRLFVVATIRWEGGGSGHLLHRWLSDIRRFPRVTEMELAGLDRAATITQLTRLLGRLPHMSLVDDVWARAQGNPYLTRLLVDGLDPAARRVAGEVPRDLRAALLASWRALNRPARDASAALAIGAAPRRAHELAAVMGDDEDGVGVALTEAAQAGLLSVQRDGAFWFRHPLGAEVIEHDLTSGERMRLHDAFAQHLEDHLVPGDVGAAVAVADHRARGADAARARATALRAVAAAEQAGAWADALRILLQLRSLAERGSPGASEASFLRRLRVAAAHASELVTELDTVDALLECAEVRAEPNLHAALLVDRAHLRFSTGRGFFDLAEAQRMVDVAQRASSTAVHALALAEYAHAALWHEQPGADAVARRALSEARRAGDDRALAYALAANAMWAVLSGDIAQAESCGAEAFDAAMRAGDWAAAVHAALWRANVETWASERYAETIAKSRERLVGAGATRAYLAKLGGVEAFSLLAVGQWAACESRLREVFAADPGPLGDGEARLTAARLAARQGRQWEAEQHLARAEELYQVTSGLLALPFDATRAEVRLGAGDTRGAFRAAMNGVASEGLRPTMCQWLLPLAARALADEIEAVHGHREGVAQRAELVRLAQENPGILLDPGSLTPLLRYQADGLGALYAAEVARGVGDDDAGELWLCAAAALEPARLPWEQAYAWRRAAEMLLVRDGERRRGAEALRTGLALARRLEAQPIVSALEALARRARISVASPPVLDGSPPGAIAPLTPREREILALVIAGRTYGEIARALGISEKTVSTHISHLFDKTGTANRVELAGMAERMPHA
jgi:DNA-binding CsgD family transcriptional regulator